MERKNNDVHLKENEVYLRIEYTENLFKAVRHYGVKKLSEGSGYKVSVQENHRRRRHHNSRNEENSSKDTRFYHEILDYGKHTINFNDTNIYINVIQFDRALSKGDMGTDFHKEMELQVLNNDNTLDSNLNYDINKLIKGPEKNIGLGYEIVNLYNWNNINNYNDKLVNINTQKDFNCNNSNYNNIFVI